MTNKDYDPTSGDTHPAYVIMGLVLTLVMFCLFVGILVLFVKNWGR